MTRHAMDYAKVKFALNLKNFRRNYGTTELMELCFLIHELYKNISVTGFRTDYEAWKCQKKKLQGNITWKGKDKK